MCELIAGFEGLPVSFFCRQLLRGAASRLLLGGFATTAVAAGKSIESRLKNASRPDRAD